MAETLQASTSAEHPLRRQLGLRDLVLAQILSVVGASWVGIAAALGRAGTLTWIAAMLLFFVPMAGSVIALNRQMPLEGGLYVWARRAFGDMGGFLIAWNLWVYGVSNTAAILYETPSVVAYLIGPKAAWIPESHLASAALVMVAMAGITLGALRGLELGKWMHNAGGVAMLSVFAILILLPVWALWRHQPIHWTPLAMQLPQRNLRSLALFGQLLFGALCGMEYIAILAGESRQPERSIGRSVWIAAPVICAMFLLGTSSVLAFHPHGDIDFIAPIPQTVRLALGRNGMAQWLAMAAILLLQIRLLAAASFAFTGVTRLPMTVGWDHLIPEWFTRLHPRRRTPTNSILWTAGLVLLLLVLANVGVHAQEAFQVLANASNAHYELAYLAMFAIPLAGALAVRKELPRWMPWLAVLGFCSTLFSLVISAYPFVDVVNPLAYAGKILGMTLCSNLLALGFYAMRHRGPGKAAVPGSGATLGGS